MAKDKRTNGPSDVSLSYVLPEPQQHVKFNHLQPDKKLSINQAKTSFQMCMLFCFPAKKLILRIVSFTRQSLKLTHGAYVPPGLFSFHLKD